MKQVVIFGTGDIGLLAHYYLTHDSSYKIAGFCADSQFITSHDFMDLPLVPFETVETIYPPAEFDMFIALSYSKLNEVRANKYYEAKDKGYTLISYVCSNSVIWDNVEIGDNCFIFENQTIQPFVKIGNNVTLWSGNHIGHHSTIDDHCFLTSHVVVSGHVAIKSHSFLGVNSTIIDGITLAPRTVIGAGALVTKNTIEEGVYTGEVAKLRTTSARRVSYFTQTRYEDKN